MIQILKDIRTYKNYIFYIVKSDLKKEVSSTFLGYAWWLLDPLFNMAIYTILVTFIFEKSIPNFPVFVYCALLPWKWLTASVSSSAKCISSNRSILNNISMPISILPIIYVTMNFIKYLFGMIVLSVLLLIFKIQLSWHILELTFIIFTNFIFILSLSMIVTHVGSRVKDLNNGLSHILRLWFYMSPGMYEISSISSKYKIIWNLNPMTSIFTSYRNVVMFKDSPLYFELFVIVFFSIIVISYYSSVFIKNKGTYAKGA